MPLFKTESESETDTLPPHSKYIKNVLTRKIYLDSTFGVYQDDTDGSLKIGRSSFKYNNKHVFVDIKKERVALIMLIIALQFDVSTSCNEKTEINKLIKIV